MNKREIIAFFDRLAPGWDVETITDDEKLRFILDAADIRGPVTVLDVACGTGVLFPYYLQRDAVRVIGVDISPGMLRIAAEKLRDPRVELICGDMEMLPVRAVCDRCVIYNAFPHFEDPSRLFERLALWVEPGGRLTVAHGMGMEELDRHHAGIASSVSRRMLSPSELSAIMAPWFDTDVHVSDSEKYVVSGLRRTEAS